MLNIRYCSRPEELHSSGQAMVWVLVMIGFSAFTMAAICRVVLWKLDSSSALLKQRNLIEQWQERRGNILKDSYPTLSFKMIGSGNNQLAIPTIPKNFVKNDFLKIPIFTLGDKITPFFNWHAFELSSPGRCAQEQKNVCQKLTLNAGHALWLGDVELESLEPPPGNSIVAVAGNLTIENLVLKPESSAEFLSGFNITIHQINGSSTSSLFLSSAHGIINLPSVNNLACKNYLPIRLSSKAAVHFKDTTINSFGCLEVKLSQFWQDLRYIGEISQKSLSY